MALTSLRHLDDETLRRLVSNPLTYLALSSPFLERDRWPLMVHYDERGVAYVPRDHFRMEPKVKRPSDCVWIVPAQRHSDPGQSVGE